MTGLLPIISCLILCMLLFFQRAVLLSISITTSRCAAILFKRHHGVASSGEYDLPTKLVYGKPLPKFEMVNLQSGELVDCMSIVGISTIFVFCTKQEFEDLELGLLAAFFQRCWHRIDGSIYIVFIDQTSMEYSDLPHAGLLDTYFGESLVFCLDIHREIGEVIGLSQTPCIVELNSGFVVTRLGLLNHND